MINFLRFKGEFFFSNLFLHIRNKRHHFFAFFMCFHNCFEHRVVIHFTGARFNHNNFFSRTYNGNQHIGHCTLGFIRTNNDLAVYQSNVNTCYRAIPRNIRNGQGKRSADHTGNFRLAIRVYRHNRHYYRYIVAHIFREQRTDRTVHHTGSQDRLFSGAAFSF